MNPSVEVGRGQEPDHCGVGGVPGLWGEGDREEVRRLDTLIHQPHWRIRTDTLDVRGHVTLRHLGKLQNLNVGWRNRGHSIRLYILDDVVALATEDGEFIGETKIDPERDYQSKGPGFR